MTITIIGLGLIGGSIALELRKNDKRTQFIGVDKNIENGKKAIEIGLVDTILPLHSRISATLEWLFKSCNVLP